MARARRRKERKKTMKLPQELAELASTVPVYIDPAGSLRAALPAALTASQASGWRQLYPTDARRIRARAQLKAGLDRDAREYRARLIAELASAPDPPPRPNREQRRQKQEPPPQPRRALATTPSLRAPGDFADQQRSRKPGRTHTPGGRK